MPKDPEIWDVIVIGRGSATRYYLTTVDRSLFTNILVVGKEDPWAGERGTNQSNPKDPKNYINQTQDMIESFDNPNVPFSKELVDRLTFAKRTAQVIDTYAAKVVDEKVVNIEVTESEMMVPITVRPSGHMRVFTVHLQDGRKFHGKKVVVATGAGPHREPAEVEGLSDKFKDHVMDMNTFARRTGQFGDPKQKTIFIHGPNAAIDTADTAKFEGYNVVWLVKKGTDIPILKTYHQIYAMKALNDKKEYTGNLIRGAASFKVAVHPGASKPITVTIDGKAIHGDLYVYGMGQEPTTAMEGVIPPELRGKLVPIYDINQRYGDVHETVLGFKLENSEWDNGFEVIGSLCTQVARMDGGVKHTYLRDLALTIQEVRSNVLQHLAGLMNDPDTKILFEKLDVIAAKDYDVAKDELKKAVDLAVGPNPSWKGQLKTVGNLLVNYNVASRFFAKKKNVSDRDDLDRVTKILTPSTAASAQLGGIRGTTAAMNGFVTDQANFSQDDRQILRITIAVKYPFVSEEDAQAIIGDIIGKEKTGRNNPKLGGYSYNQTQKAVFEYRLKEANLKGTMPVTQPKHIGTGKTPAKKWKMENDKGGVFIH